MTQVFLSYSHKDQSYADALAASLNDRGVSVWLDSEVDHGSDWPTVVEDHLANCDSLVLLMSDDSRRSRWVRNELHVAMDHNKPILPLLLSGQRWFEVATIQYVDVSDGALPPDDFYRRVTAPTSDPTPRDAVLEPEANLDAAVTEEDTSSSWHEALGIQRRAGGEWRVDATKFLPRWHAIGRRRLLILTAGWLVAWWGVWVIVGAVADANNTIVANAMVSWVFISFGIYYLSLLIIGHRSSGP